MDTMTFTKVMGSVCGALLILLVGKWMAEELYAVGGHGKGDVVQAYVIDTGEDEEVAEEVVEVAFADVYEAAAPADGERLWRQCRACHQLEPGANATGPYLHGVVGREIASVDSFGGYSGNLPEGEWTPENINGFLEAPRTWAPGTSMGYAGMRDVEDRAALIAYMATFN